MTDPDEGSVAPQHRSRWVAVIAGLALAGGIAVGASQWSRPQSGRVPAPAPEPQPAGQLPEGHPPLDGSASMPSATMAAGGKLPEGHPPLDGSGAAVASGSMPPVTSPSGDPGYVSIDGMHALIKAGLAPTNRRVWVDEVVGVDGSGLSVKQREIFLRHANAEDCICGYTVASCRAFNRSCPAGPGKAAALLDSVCSGKYKNAEHLRERPRGILPAGHPTAP